MFLHSQSHSPLYPLRFPRYWGGVQKQSSEENICILIMHFQCKNKFEHLLNIYILIIMLKTFITALAFYAISLPTLAQAQQHMVEYFVQQLEGKQATASNNTFKIKQLDAKRHMVWEAWKMANQRAKTLPQLPFISPLGSVSASWQLPANLEPHATLPYYYGYKGEKPNAGYPFFLYLHGSGPKNQEWATGLALAQRFNDAPSVYFIPQIPNEGEWYRWWQHSKQYAWENLLRTTLLSDSINPNRLYVFGISEGGYGSQRLASYYADYWAAAGPMAGGEPLKNAPVENLCNIGFTFYTGADDAGFYRNTLTNYTREALDSLQKLYPTAFQHKVVLVPNRQHFIDYSVTTPELLQFTRNPHPTHFIWEDFEMDGQHRKGFYNLCVLQRPDKKARTRYDVNINNNIVNIQVRNVDYTTTQRDSIFGIEMKFNRNYSTASGGQLRVYLDEKLVDLSQPITIIINDKQVCHAKAQLSLKHLEESLCTFYDRERMFPVAFDVKY